MYEQLYQISAVRCNRLRRHNDEASTHSWSSRQASRTRPIARLFSLPRWCALLSCCYCCASPLAHTQTLPHLRPFTTQSHLRDATSLSSIASQIALRISIDDIPRSFSSRIPQPPSPASSETFVSKNTAPTHHRISRRSHNATNLQPGAHQDHQKTLFRHAS